MERAVVVVVQNAVSVGIRVTRVTKLGIGMATPSDLSAIPDLIINIKKNIKLLKVRLRYIEMK